MDQKAMNVKLEERAKLLEQSRSILDKAESEKRNLTAEEQETWDKLQKDAGDIYETVKRAQAQARLEAESTRSQEDAGGAAAEARADLTDPKKYDDILYRYVHGERDVLSAEQARALQSELFRRYLQRGETQLSRDEIRALQVDKGSSGGYLVPDQFISDLIKAIDDLVFLRQWSTVISVPNADSLGAPSLDNDPADPAWTSELAIGSEDSTMSFGKRELSPKPLAKYIKISRTLLRKAPNVEDLVRARLAYKQAIAQENAFLTGSGAGQPLGVFTASDDGIGTARDVSTGNTATEVRFDGLLGAKFSIKPQYWPNLRWVFHRDVMLQVAKLKDGEGQYLWRESVRAGEPDRLLGLPVYMSENAPSTMTTGLYVGIIGDFRNYWIADCLNQELQRLDELFAATNQVGLVIRSETDGMPVLAEAFARVTLA
jgi:HK97 family phage major capsid protein